MIKENIKKLKEEIEETAIRCGRNPEEIIIVGATKTVEPAKIEEAYHNGIKIFGENKIQEAERKIPLLSHLDIEWHFIGHLQSNKARKAVKMFKIIQSIDKFSTLEKVDRIAGELNKIQEIFIEVNTSGEESKFGLNPDEVIDFIGKAKELKNIKITGLMTIGPLTDNESDIRNSFLLLKDLKDKINKFFTDIKIEYLSMGMTDDFKIAIECGSNMIRIGRKIFGERKYD